jgi:hypothetical protein
MMKTTFRIVFLVVMSLAMTVGCDREDHAHTSDDGDDHGEEPTAAKVAPTNRVDIPAAVRGNLGVTFAKVEYRKVAQTLRVPGRFELLPTARREYRTPLAGRVEVLVSQYQRVDVGTPLYRVDSPAWRELHEQIAATEARVQSMAPIREAHRRHETVLSDKVALWQDRLKQLEELRSAGGGSAAQSTEARATLNATQAELADVMEKEAELEAQQKQAEAELRTLRSHHDILVRSASWKARHDGPEPDPQYTVHAVAPGTVEAIGITPGGLAEENGLVLSVVQPEQIRFRARGLQSDLGKLREGLPAAIVPPQGGSIPLHDVMTGTLQVGLSADPDERTVDLIVKPETIASWARSGISGHLEITLAGGDAELAIPLAAVVRDGLTPVIFRRDPANPDQAIRMNADLGLSDGRWAVIASGVKEGDEVVVDGNYQLMLATSGTAAKGGHFHTDGTFHDKEH